MKPAGAFSLLSALSAGLMMGPVLDVDPDGPSARERMGERQRARLELRRREDASRAWAETPPTVMPAPRPRCTAGPSCADLECPHHGKQLRKLARRAARAAPPAPRSSPTFVPTVAEQERRRLIERTRAGLDRARAAGKRFGRPPRVTADVVRACARLRQEGRSTRAIAVALKLPATSVRRALKAAELAQLALAARGLDELGSAPQPPPETAPEIPAGSGSGEGL